jgi:molecular chaperone HscB
MGNVASTASFSAEGETGRMVSPETRMNKQSEIHCGYCGFQSDDPHFCSGCGKIQPVRDGSDFFTFFGLPRKLVIDESALESTFYKLSRQFHPDYFMSASESERDASVQRSSLLNDAYRTLRDRIKRVSYLLTLEGYKEAEKKAPPDLLEEVFELNMQIEELKEAKGSGDDADLAQARLALEDALASLKEKLASIDTKLAILFQDWDRAVDRDDPAKKAVLDRISELLSHRSYINHLVNNVLEEL